jgi:hypothetical protein
MIRRIAGTLVETVCPMTAKHGVGLRSVGVFAFMARIQANN